MSSDSSASKKPVAVNRSGKKKLIIRIMLVILIGAVFGAYYGLDAGQWLNTDTLFTHRAQLQTWIETHFISSVLISTAIYIGVVVFSLPGATPLSLGIGFLFGLWPGVPMALFAASIGALLCFWAVRWTFADWARAHIPPIVLERIDQGLATHGFYYMLFLRLVPAFPFFSVNLAMALTTIRSRLFFISTLLGILPGTIVFVNAGRALGEATSIQTLISPSVLGAFALLGVFALIPVLYAKIKARRVNHPSISTK